MTTVFHKTLRRILFISKCSGLIDISYTLEPTGLLVRNINSKFHAFLEIALLIVLLICTYSDFSQFKQKLYLLQILNSVKFWIVIIAARLSTVWTIKLINGIVEFDRKITPLLTNLLISQRSWTNKHWNTIFISLFAYFIGFKSLHIYIWPLKFENILLLVHRTIFNVPCITDYAISISSCFFLQNLYVRFQTLNDCWKCLPADLVDTSGQWTHTEIVVLMENTRLLHAELCDLLKMFSLGYGSLLLGFFSMSYINLLTTFYFVINSKTFSSTHSSSNVWDYTIPLLFNVQVVTFLMSIIVFVSFINEKRMEMISCLRLYRISNLHIDKKRQIKMFMIQISACNSDQISAFGFFDINLNLVTSILVLLISGIITLIQMKDHPIILKLNNDTKSYLGTSYISNNYSYRN